MKKFVMLVLALVLCMNMVAFSAVAERMSDVKMGDDYAPTALESMHNYWKRKSITIKWFAIIPRFLKRKPGIWRRPPAICC